MMKLFFYLNILFFSLGFQSCKIENSENPFLVAYKINSGRKLNTILKVWENATPTISDSLLALSSDTTKIIYEIVESLFNPLDYLFYKNQNYHIEKGINKTQKYIIANNKIHYSIYDTLFSPVEFDFNKKTKKYSSKLKKHFMYKNVINNFRPKFRYGAKILFLNQKYFSLIEEFLPSTSVDRGDTKYDDLFFENKKRRKFLQQYIILNDYVGYLSTPYIKQIKLNSKLDEAYISFQSLAGSKVTYFKKRNNQWVYIRTVLTVIH